MNPEKAALRIEMRAVRDSIPASVRADASARICAHILASPLLENCKTLLCYAPIRSEVDLTGLAEGVLALGKAVGFPICGGENMEFYAVDTLGALSEADAFGIPIPKADERRRITPDADTLVLVPGLAFDEKGNRIGYGKGYYDRYLHRFPAPTVLGVTFAETLLAHIPTENTDIPAAYLATENGIIRIHE